jgi:phage gp46-like protein
MLDWSLDRDIKFLYETPSKDRLGPAQILHEAGGRDIVGDNTYETAITISLFSNARASGGEPLPPTTAFKHGYFGSLLARMEIGSLLWLLDRAKNDEETARRGVTYIERSLQWMVDRVLASSVSATYRRVSGQNRINFFVLVARLDGVNMRMGFGIDWTARRVVGVV